MKALLDKHAPLRPTVVRRRQSAPWYNAECRRVKAKTRRLEKIFRATRSEDARRRWGGDQFAEQRSMFQWRYADYWRKAITDSEDSKTLWRRLNVVLHPPGAVVSPFSANDFASFFDIKISAIRLSSATAGAPTVDPREHRSTLSGQPSQPSMLQRHYTAHHASSANRTRSRRSSYVLSPVIATMINCSFGTATFPVSQKQSSHFSKSQTWKNMDMKSSV